MMLKKSQKAEFDKRIFAGKRVSIVRSLFNERLTGSLLEHCRRELVAGGVDEGLITAYEVPGALEIPLVARLIAQQDLADVIVALGVIIKGDT